MNEEGKRTFVKFHYKSDGGVKSLTSDAAERMRGADTDYLRRDITEFITAGGEVTYTMFMQLIPEADVPSLPYNIFDVTKVVPHGDYPLQAVGKLVLNRMPENFFEETVRGMLGYKFSTRSRGCMLHCAFVPMRVCLNRLVG